MTGCVFDIRHYSVHDGPGIRTSVFLKGCPLRCQWCHNPEGFDTEPTRVNRERKAGGKLISMTNVIGSAYTVDQVVEEVLKSRIFFDESGGGVTFSGGEPLMQPEFTEACMDRIKQEGIHIALDTSGYAARTVFDRIVGKSDLVLFDLKHYDTDLHKQYTGVPLKPILENLRSTALSKTTLIARIPLIPGFNIDNETLDRMAEILLDIPTIQGVDLLPYHNIAIHKYDRLGIDYSMRHIEAPTKAEVDEAANLFRKKGLKVKIGG